MFIKFVYNDGAHEKFYECGNYDLDVLSGTEGPDKLMFELYGVPNTPTGTSTIEVEKRGSNAVYIMNNSGRTVESFQWAGHKFPDQRAPVKQAIDDVVSMVQGRQ